MPVGSGVKRGGFAFGDRRGGGRPSNHWFDLLCLSLDLKGAFD